MNPRPAYSGRSLSRRPTPVEAYEASLDSLIYSLETLAVTVQTEASHMRTNRGYCGNHLGLGNKLRAALEAYERTCTYRELLPLLYPLELTEGEPNG